MSNTGFVLRIPVEITAEQIKDAVYDRSMDHDDVEHLILSRDLAIADGGFTEHLIEALCKSLRGDLSEKEYKDFVDGLGRISND